jgi:bifunctional non-homologous end joining protein LigD
MRLAVRRDPFDHPDWLYELKLDGFRALAVIESGACRLVSRKANVYKSFPGVCSLLAELPHEAVLDGEIVCLDRNGCPQFESLFYRRGEPYFYAFDVPYLDGRGLREMPLIERKRILRGIMPHCDSRFLYLSHVEGSGVDLFGEICRRDLEGIVAKWKHGTYMSGDVTSWVKIKNPAYSQAVGRWEQFQRKSVRKALSPTSATKSGPEASGQAGLAPRAKPFDGLGRSSYS